MRLYEGSSKLFIEDTTRNLIAEKLRKAYFEYFRYNPSDSEVYSWQNSLGKMKDVLQHGNMIDHGVVLEYQLPLSSKRLDCMVCGNDAKGNPNAVIIELKQWSKCTEAIGANELRTVIGGGPRDVLHPSAQVSYYREYLQDTHTAFYEGDHPVTLSSCAYLHNYIPENEDMLFGPKFHSILANSPVFTAHDFDEIGSFLAERLEKGQGMPILAEVVKSKYKPSKKLMEHIAGVIGGEQQYVLLDEQRIVYDKIIGLVEKGFHKTDKYAVIVQGGPGTGKSVIAINLMADLLLKGYNAHYATGSRAFTETLRNVIGRRGGIQFKYFNSYSDAQTDDIDVLICDESHRIRQTSNNWRTKKESRSKQSQIEELLNVGRVCVFFIDDDQVVRPGEIGSSEYIAKAADGKKIRHENFTLDIQFRCAGSQGFISWIENTLGIHRTANVIWNSEEENFDFQILDSAHQLDEAIKKLVAQGNSARLVAGFCWPWSEAQSDGTLKDDVVIGDFKRPWNAKSEASRLAAGIPKATLWANDPGGINQVGCVYTAQGFEFDYVGVIFGKDLLYSFDRQEWHGNKEVCCDRVVKRGGQNFLNFIKNTYRVLLSRGLKGCYVYFEDKEVERFFKSRMEVAGTPKIKAEATKTVILEKRVSAELPFSILRQDKVRPFENCVPLYDLKIAAGILGDEEYHPNMEDTKWVTLPGTFRPNESLFVAKTYGESMNRRIPNGAYCLFQKYGGGTREGKVVLLQHKTIIDPEIGGSFMVKIYRSKKEKLPDGTWRHLLIMLEPDSDDPSFKPMVVPAENAEDFKIVAEMVTVLG